MMRVTHLNRGGGGGDMSTLKLFMPGHITSIHYYPVLYEHSKKGAAAGNSGVCVTAWCVC